MSLTDRKGPLYMVAASICWSLGGLCIKFIPWSAMCIIGLRAGLAAVVFAIYRRSVTVSFNKGNLLAALCLSGTTILFVFANQLTTAAAAILLQFTSPVFIILIELVLYKRKPALGTVVAVLITIMGMLLFFADFLFVGDGAKSSDSLLGNLLAIGSGVFFAGVFVCNKRPDVNTEQSLMLGFLINAAIGLPFILTGVTADPVAWGFAILLGVVQVGLAYVFFTIGIKKTSALLACLITALEPVLNPVWVALGTGEMPGKFAIAGGVVIVLTVTVYNVWVEKRQNSDSGQALKT